MNTPSIESLKAIRPQGLDLRLLDDDEQLWIVVPWGMKKGVSICHTSQIYETRIALNSASSQARTCPARHSDLHLHQRRSRTSGPMEIKFRLPAALHKSHDPTYNTERLTLTF